MGRENRKLHPDRKGCGRRAHSDIDGIMGVGMVYTKKRFRERDQTHEVLVAGRVLLALPGPRGRSRVSLPRIEAGSECEAVEALGHPSPEGD